MKANASIIQLVICYFLALLVVAFMLSSCAPVTTNRATDFPCHFSNHREMVNTMEDMVEWIEWDIAEGRVDSTTGQQYIQNLSYFVN